MEYRVLETRSADILTKYYSNEIDSFLNACHEDILWIGPAEKHVIRTREALVDAFSQEEHIQIPVIDVDLAIYHGTSDEVLNRGIGHFEFSSLPVGGKNSHCILTGHRGLPSAKLFTRLDELKKKDQIYIHVCKKTLAYEVVDSFVVEPEDILDMAIEKDQDLLSLVTCTPYGINTKRLVVKAKRIFPKKKNQPRKSYSMREFLFLIIPVVFLIVFKVVRR